MNRAVVVTALTVGVLAGGSARTEAALILTDLSLGYYNAALGTTLDGSAGFPCANIACGDPTVLPPAPDLTAGAAILGGWLGPTPLPFERQLEWLASDSRIMDYQR